MKRYLIAWLFSLLFVSCQEKAQELKVMQFNIWQEGTVVEGGFPAIVEHIYSLQPDLVTFSEVRNYEGVSFIPKLLDALKERGVIYYGEESVSTGIISKFPIEKQEIVYPLKNDRGSVIKAVIPYEDKQIMLYSAHLDWLNCSSYLPRGYHSSTWEKLEEPVLDLDSILRDNRLSFRDDEIQAILDDIQKNTQDGNLILIGGDFNEPSHLDWQANTAQIRDHQGLVINWDCSVLLVKFGLKDCYREIYPDPVAYPGFTFPSNNLRVPLNKLVWAQDSDERERIDFIYYQPTSGVKLKDAIIVGPKGNVLKGELIDQDPDGNDPFIEPIGTWPTDHKALLVTFAISH